MLQLLLSVSNAGLLQAIYTYARGDITSMEHASTPEERFATIVGELLVNPDVTPPSDRGRKFGSTELKVHNKIFAMLVRGRLVVKLPESRVNVLVASGDGERFDPRHDGRLMKEWICLEPTSKQTWLEAAQEAMEFVGSKK
jgi:hypothetical protein